HFLEREKRAERFGVDVILLFLELVGVVAPIPYADLSLGIVRILRFHFLERGDFGGELWLNARDQIVDVRFRTVAGLGHFNFGLVIVPGFVAEPERDLVAQRKHLVQHGLVGLFGQTVMRDVKFLARRLAFGVVFDRVVLPGHIGEHGVGVVAGFDSGR